MSIALIEKGIDANQYAANIIKALCSTNNGWMVTHFLERGMRVDNDNFSALDACVQEEQVEIGKLLLNRGMGFDEYLVWSKELHKDNDAHAETLQVLSEHWKIQQDNVKQKGMSLEQK